MLSLKKPPPCHLPAAATPHARRAHPTAKNFVFASGPPSYRPGEVRSATSLELRPVVSLPSLAQTHMFFGGCKAQRLLTSFNAAASACHQPSPKGNPRLLSSTCCFGKTQRPLFGSCLRLIVPGQRQKLDERSSLHFIAFRPHIKHLPTVSLPHPTHPFRCGIFLKISIK